MQVQDYLPFFQDLLLQYYQFTLENPVYAACLAVAVWLLTTIFYSLRIGFLNRRNRINLKASLDAQNNLTAAQQEIQRLQEEVVASKEQIDQEAQRSVALQERLGGLAGQLSESIVALAAEPDLGQQGLSVTKDLEIEHLWQRYSAAVKHLGENLIAERKNIGELRQAFDAETAKLAEKDGQLQAMQTRLDSQSQRLAKLELSNEEYQTQLAQQQENAQRRLSEIEAKHQSDLARLAALEKQSMDGSQAKLSPEKPKVPDTRRDEPEQLIPSVVRAVPAPAVSVEPEPKQVKVETKPVAREVATPEPTIARAETTKQQTKVAGQASDGVSGKFKSLFAGAKQQMEKLDDMFGLSTPMLDPKESSPTARPVPEPQTVVTQAPISKPEVFIPVQQLEITVKEPSAGLTGKFKNLFGSSKSPSIETATVEEKQAETVPAESAPQPVSVADPTDVDSGKAPGKLKNLFGKLKRNP